MRILPTALLIALPLIAIATPAIAGPPQVQPPARPGAEVWVATHTLFRGDVVQNQDVATKAVARVPYEAVSASQNIVGLEVKQSIYSGRAITQRDVGPPSLVKVSTQVEVIWKAPGIELQLAGRALDSGAMGDEIRVLNPSTSRTIRGKVVGEGLVEVQSAP